MAAATSSASTISERIQTCVRLLIRDINDGQLPEIVVSRYKAREGASDSLDTTKHSIYEKSESKWILSVRRSSVATPSRLVAFLGVLKIVQELLFQKKHATKRDVYYTNTTLFKDQVMVDRALIDIGTYFKCPRSELNVVSSCKGYIQVLRKFDDINLHFRTKASHGAAGVQGAGPISGLLAVHKNRYWYSFISFPHNRPRVGICGLSIIPSFLRLADDGFCEKNDAIILTGKGYPDVATRLFLRLLSEKLAIPLFGVTDGDPHGLDIMCTYRFGSLQMAHDAHNLATPRLQWMGVFPADVEQFGIPARCCLPLSKRDMSKGEALLKREHLRSLAPSWCRHMQEMLDRGWKVEIEALAAVSMTMLSDVYLPTKVKEQFLAGPCQ